MEELKLLDWLNMFNIFFNQYKKEIKELRMLSNKQNKEKLYFFVNAKNWKEVDLAFETLDDMNLYYKIEQIIDNVFNRILWRLVTDLCFIFSLILIFNIAWFTTLFRCISLK